jgi:hypothetical protein
MFPNSFLKIYPSTGNKNCSHLGFSHMTCGCGSFQQQTKGMLRFKTEISNTVTSFGANMWFNNYDIPPYAT